MVQEHRCRDYLRLSQLDTRVDYVIQFLDSDDDCCKEINKKLLRWSSDVVYRTKFDVICIEREFECWLLAGIVSLRGVRRIFPDAAAPTNPNVIRGAKARLSDVMPRGIPYSETVDQAALVSSVDLSSVSLACPSFKRLVAKLTTVHGQLCRHCDRAGIRG
jgi:hypothetical protein